MENNKSTPPKTKSPCNFLLRLVCLKCKTVSYAYYVFITIKNLFSRFANTGMPLILLVILVPIGINIAYMIGANKQNTVFEASHLLSYVGLCIFGWVVYYQTKKLHIQNYELQKQSLRLENNNMKFITYAYLRMDEIECNLSKTQTLIKPIPWPLDVREGLYLCPRERFLKVPLGNSEDFSEDIVEEKVFFDFETKNGSIHLCIDPYVGIDRSGSNNPALVLWTIRDLFRLQGNYPRYKPYHTNVQLLFRGKSSRDFFIDKIEINNLELNLTAYGDDKEEQAYWFATEIYTPLVVKPISTDNYTHDFRLELHLCHSYEKMLKSFYVKRIELRFNIVYVNMFGVRVKCHQSLIFEYSTTKTTSEKINNQIHVESIDIELK